MSESKILSRPEFVKTVERGEMKHAGPRGDVFEHDAGQRARIAELESFQANYEHATKMEREETAAEVESLRRERDAALFWGRVHSRVYSAWEARGGRGNEVLLQIAEDIWVTDSPIGEHTDSTKSGHCSYGLVLVNEIGMSLKHRDGVINLGAGQSYCINGRLPHSGECADGSLKGLFSALIWDMPEQVTMESFREQADIRIREWLSDPSEVSRLTSERDAAITERDEANETLGRTVSVVVGTSCLTRDLVWCGGCARGLSRLGNWYHCPQCGGKIDQESYRQACAEAERNGGNIARYVSGERADQIKQLEAERDAARDWIKAAHKFAWAHERTCPRHDADERCTCGLDEFLSRPRPYIESLIAERDAAIEAGKADRVAIVEAHRVLVDSQFQCPNPLEDGTCGEEGGCHFHAMFDTLCAAMQAAQVEKPE